jgi:hypothetical protein
MYFSCSVNVFEILTNEFSRVSVDLSVFLLISDFLIMCDSLISDLLSLFQLVHLGIAVGVTVVHT